MLKLRSLIAFRSKIREGQFPDQEIQDCVH